LADAAQRLDGLPVLFVAVRCPLEDHRPATRYRGRPLCDLYGGGRYPCTGAPLAARGPR
jgi:chloramphenicol 3-O-phosphotransferase